MKLITNPYSFDELKLEIDGNGFAHTNAKLMKVGQLKYRNPDGSFYYANISLDDLKEAQSKLGPISITYRHPKDLISPKDIKDHHVGMTKGKPQIQEIDGETWLTDGAIIQDKTAINVAKEGKTGGSTGYWRDAIKVSDGVVDFKNILPNHYAIGCLSPRAKGAELFSLDSSDSESGRILELDKQQTPKKKGVRMKRKLNSVKGQGYSADEAMIEYADESDAVVEQIVLREKSLIGQFDTELETQKKSFDEKTETLTTEKGVLSGEVKALKAKNEELELSLKDTMSLDDAKGHIKEMSDVKAVAESYGITEDFETPEAGKRLVVEKVYSQDEWEDSEVEGGYKSITKNPKDSKELKKAADLLKKHKKKADGSMDAEGKKVISISQISVSALKRAKEIQRRRNA